MKQSIAATVNPGKFHIDLPCRPQFATEELTVFLRERFGVPVLDLRKTVNRTKIEWSVELTLEVRSS